MMFVKGKDEALLKSIVDVMKESAQETEEQRKKAAEYLEKTAYAGMRLEEKSDIQRNSDRASRDAKEFRDRLARNDERDNIARNISKVARSAHPNAVAQAGQSSSAFQPAKTGKTKNFQGKPEGVQLSQEEVDLDFNDLLEYMLTPEFDQLDEISKETLKSYIPKAARSFGAAHDRETYGKAGYGVLSQVDTKTISKRTKGLTNAVKKMTKEEFEQLDEVSKNTLKSYMHKAGISFINAHDPQKYGKAGEGVSAQSDTKTISKRTKGISRALAKLTKEEFEQLDEISKGTLGSYIKKATSAGDERSISNFRKEEAELEEAVGDNHLHVQQVKHEGQTKYKVHAVGKNFADGIKVGEHLSDTELDDFSEMGGKIKHVKPAAAKPMKEARSLSAILDEARGRPSKKASEDEDEDDEGPDTGPEADQNIMVHLRKSTDTEGNHDVKFSDGSSHKVPAHVAHKVLGAMEKLKPADRAKIQSHIQQSHANLMAVHKMVS